MFKYYLTLIKHKGYVFGFCFRFILALFWRMLIHDWSKFVYKETKLFMGSVKKLRNASYGSEEYYALLREMQPSLDHHYKYNRHHPEHFTTYTDMDLVDIVEMFFDWWAATKKHKVADVKKSINHNQTRFNMSDDIVTIFHNTYKRFS